MNSVLFGRLIIFLDECNVRLRFKRKEIKINIENRIVLKLILRLSWILGCILSPMCLPSLAGVLKYPLGRRKL